jgi:hypothetical protein
MTTTPEYIASLLKPQVKSQGRKVWSVDLETVWLPFFTATNTVKATAIPHEALGAPLRLAYNPDKTVKFNERSGKPVIRVAKELADSVRLVRENFIANLQHYAGSVRKDNPEGYTNEVRLNTEAGRPIVMADRAALDKAIEEAMSEAMKDKETATPNEANLVTA